jgi:hypothetical protein
MPLPLVESLEPGVLEAAVLREEEGVEGMEEPERENELAWDLILERRWVMALGVTSVWGGRVSCVWMVIVCVLDEEAKGKEGKEKMEE